MGNINWDDISDEKLEKLVKEIPEYKPSQKMDSEMSRRLYEYNERAGVLGFLAPAAAMLGVILLWNYYFCAVDPLVAKVQGNVKILRHGTNDWQLVEKSGTRLHKGDVIKTFDDSEADLVLKALYHIRLKPGSELILKKSPSRALSQNTEYLLDKGKVLTNYNSARTWGGEFRIYTGQAVAACLGTDFMVQAMPARNETWVGVLDGLVRVSNITAVPGKAFVPAEVRILAGQKTTIEQGKHPRKPERLLYEELFELEELYGLGTKPQVSLLISHGPSRTRELLSVTPLYVSMKASDILPEKLEEMINRFNVAIREGSKAKHEQNIKLLEELVEKYPNPEYDVQFMLFIASYYDYLGQYPSAISAFEKVLNKYPDSSLASVAQCAIGIIFEERLKDKAKALDAYKNVLKRYPQSPEIQEAKEGIKRMISSGN